MKFFSLEENTKSIKRIVILALLSAMTYGMMVSVILPSSKYFVNYTDEQFLIDFYSTQKKSFVQIFAGVDGNGPTGSGVYLAGRFIVTNHHVIKSTLEGGGLVTVISEQGIMQGKVVESHPESVPVA